MLLKISKLFQNSKNLLSVRYFSSRRFQFKVQETIYYPKRGVLWREDALKAPLIAQEKVQKSLMPTIDYYKILGVRKAATIQEIKAAYYDLAKKFHPDANSTPQETQSFQQISEAYDVLTDESNRRQYDQFGTVENDKHFINKLTPGKTADYVATKTLNFLKLLHENVSPNNNDTKYDEKDIPNTSKVKNEVTVDLEFLQAVHGSKEYIYLNGIVKCPRCLGAPRPTNQANIEFCQRCGGTGQYRVKTERNTTSKICDLCDGKRYVSKTSCKKCDNRGFVVEKQRVEVNIPPGSATGDILKISNPLNKQIETVRLNVEQSKHFKRVGKNIATEKYLTISQAVLGGKFRIRGLYEDLEVNLGPGIESHTTHCFKGKGIQTRVQPYGDHIVTFKIRIPKTLTMKQRQLMLALSRAEDPTFDGQH